MLSWSRSRRPSQRRWSVAGQLRRGSLDEGEERRRVAALDLGRARRSPRAARRRTRGSCRASGSGVTPSISSARTRLWSASDISPSRTSTAELVGRPADRLGRLELAAADEHGQPATGAAARPRRAGRSSRRSRRAASAGARAGRASPAASTPSWCSRRSRIASGDRSLIRAAASSIASGIPWSRAQIAATAGAFSFVTSKSGRTATRPGDEQPDGLVLGRDGRRRADRSLARQVQLLEVGQREDVDAGPAGPGPGTPARRRPGAGPGSSTITDSSRRGPEEVGDDRRARR